MKAKIQAILDAAPNPWAALFGIRLLLSSRKTREEWFAAGYRFPWERDSHSPEPDPVTPRSPFGI